MAPIKCLKMLTNRCAFPFWQSSVAIFQVKFQGDSQQWRCLEWVHPHARPSEFGTPDLFVTSKLLDPLGAQIRPFNIWLQSKPGWVWRLRAAIFQCNGLVYDFLPTNDLIVCSISNFAREVVFESALLLKCDSPAILSLQLKFFDLLLVWGAISLNLQKKLGFPFLEPPLPKEVSLLKFGKFWGHLDRSLFVRRDLQLWPIPIL